MQTKYQDKFGYPVPRTGKTDHGPVDSGIHPAFPFLRHGDEQWQR